MVGQPTASFIDHSLAWVRGEMLEMTTIAAFGLAALAAGLAFWGFGNGPAARSAIVPMVVLGLLFLATGVALYVESLARLEAFPGQFAADAAAFVVAERQRVDAFMPIYAITLAVATGLLAIAMAVPWLTGNLTWRAIALALGIAGIGALAIDYFSKERADVYRAHIAVELARIGG